MLAVEMSSCYHRRVLQFRGQGLSVCDVLGWMLGGGGGGGGGGGCGIGLGRWKEEVKDEGEEEEEEEEEEGEKGGRRR